MTPEQAENNRRRRHVRRIYNKYPLMAIPFIKARYPDYREDQLQGDLKLKGKSKKRKKKKKQVRDFRSLQLGKYKVLLYTTIKNSREYNRICTHIALLTDALNKKKDIELTVKRGNITKVYPFKWHTTEGAIKEFIHAANDKSNTWEDLDKKKIEITKMELGMIPK